MYELVAPLLKRKIKKSIDLEISERCCTLGLVNNLSVSTVFKFRMFLVDKYYINKLKL